ncbi:transposase, partial [Cupriavidus necator]
MCKDEHKTREPKGVYRVRNCRAYNAGLIARGDVMMWIDRSVLKQEPEAGSLDRGRPRVYSDAVIQMLLGLKQVFRLPLRALQGFAHSVRRLAFADLPVPNYTTLRRRAQELEVVLPVVLPVQHADESLHLVVDSTGLKVFGVCASQERLLG